jgi:hypothetical protein
MNAEMIQGRIKLSDECQELKDEMLNLIWNDKSLKREEHPNCANHLCDSFLYSWRFCYQFLSKAAGVKPDLRDRNQYVAYTQKLMEENLEKQIKFQQDQDNEDAIWNLSGMDL